MSGFKVYRYGGQTDNQIQQPVSPPTGSIVAFTTATAPAGWLLCQGQEISRTTYADLDGVIGTTYGSYTNGSGASGTTHFRLPDLQSRVLIGSGVGAAGTNRSLNTTGGVSSVTLDSTQTGIASHAHSVTESEHNHSVANDSHSHGIGHNAGSSISTGTGIFATATAFPYTFPLTAPADSVLTSTEVSMPAGGWYTINSATTGMTVQNASATTASEAHTNIQPTMVLAYIIKH